MGNKPGGKPPQPPTEGPLPSDQINLTDEDSRIMPMVGGGFEQCYNAQAAVAARLPGIKIEEMALNEPSSRAHTSTRSCRRSRETAAGIERSAWDRKFLHGLEEPEYRASMSQ